MVLGRVEGEETGYESGKNVGHESGVGRESGEDGQVLGG